MLSIVVKSARISTGLEKWYLAYFSKQNNTSSQAHGIFILHKPNLLNFTHFLMGSCLKKFLEI